MFKKMRRAGIRCLEDEKKTANGRWAVCCFWYLCCVCPLIREQGKLAGDLYQQKSIYKKRSYSGIV